MMFKIILKALLGTAVVAAAVIIFSLGAVALFEYAEQTFGHYGPLVVIFGACAVVIFSIFVSFFRHGATQKLKRNER